MPGLHRGGYPVGETAIALLAMRYAGVPLEDEVFKKGLDYVCQTATRKTYSNSLVAHLLASIPAEQRTAEMNSRLTALKAFFEDSQLPNGTWTYFPVGAGERTSNLHLAGDNSNTQFAVLALWKLAEAGIDINPQTWKNSQDYFFKTQGASGGWGYWSPEATTIASKEIRMVSGPTPTMTMTGLASLFIFREQMHLRATASAGSGRTRRCTPSAAEKMFEKRIDTAMEQAQLDLRQWIAGKRLARGAAQRAGKKDARTMNTVDLYYAYSVERVGQTSGWKDLGSVSWYGEIARLLLADQNDDGSWSSASPDRSAAGGLGTKPAGKEPATVAETALAVMFLAKGRSAIFFNKLRYDGDWNTCRQDVANLTRYATENLEYPFNWQVVDIQGEPITWLDSPVLFVNGQRGPAGLSKEEKAKLKQYVDAGWLIYAEACCGSSGFISVMKSVGKQLWPDLQWTPVPDDHPLMTRKTQFDLVERPSLVALSNADGFAFFILSLKDLSPSWHYDVRADQDAFRFAVNVYRYANRGKPIRPRSAD
jgi:hypothetical protein